MRVRNGDEVIAAAVSSIVSSIWTRWLCLWETPCTVAVEVLEIERPRVLSATRARYTPAYALAITTLT